MLVAGDSQAQLFGDSVVIRAADGGRLATVEVDSRVATGLARPDNFNWPNHLAAELEEHDYEAVVLMMGANDLQDMRALDGSRLVEGTEAWFDEYERRVRVTLELLEAPHRHVYWVLQLPLSNEDNDLVRRLNAAVDDAVATFTGNASTIDGYGLFSDDAGNYQAFLETDTGEVKRVRSEDGIHLDRAGAAWLSRVAYAELVDEWGLAPQ